MKIVYVDSDVSVRDTMAHYLQQYGFEILYFERSSEALDALEKTECDLLICSAFLEPFDGYTLCDRIRKSEGALEKEVPIFLVAPETPDQERYRYMRDRDVNFLPRYAGPEIWHERILMQCSKT